MYTVGFGLSAMACVESSVGHGASDGGDDDGGEREGWGRARGEGER